VQQPQGYGQQPYGAPQGQPGPNPYGQANAAWSPPGGAPPQPPKKKSHAGIIVAVVAIVLVLMVAGGAAMWLSQAQSTTKTAVTTSTAPTSSTTKATTTATKATTAASQATGPAGTLDVTCSGTTIDSSAFTAKVPSGWSCASQTSSLVLSDKKYDTLMVMNLSYTSDAATVCNSLASAGTMTALPDTQWGGQTAKTADLESSGTKMHVRCVSVNNSVYYLMAIPITGTYAEIVAGVDALTSGWTWK